MSGTCEGEHPRHLASLFHVERSAVPVWLAELSVGPVGPISVLDVRVARLLERAVVAAGHAWQHAHGPAGLSGRVDLRRVAPDRPGLPNGSPPAGLLAIGPLDAPIRLELSERAVVVDLDVGDLVVVPAGFLFPLRIHEPHPAAVFLAGLG